MNANDKSYVINTICDNLIKNGYSVEFEHAINKYNDELSKINIEFTKDNITNGYSILDSFFDNMSKENTLELIKDEDFIKSLRYIATNEKQIYRTNKVKTYISKLKDLRKEYLKKEIYLDFCCVDYGIETYAYNDDLKNGKKTAVRVLNAVTYLVLIMSESDIIKLHKENIDKGIKEGLL